MRIKILVLSLVATILTITMSTTTMSYFIDSDQSEAMFTVGSVRIQNVFSESEVGEDMETNSKCTKSYAVRNTGSSLAYVRVRVLVPENLLSVGSPTLAIATANDEYVESLGSVFCNGVDGDLCREYVSTWDEPLAADTETSSRNITFTYLLVEEASTEGDGGEGGSINPANLGIKIYTEAIQAQGFANASEAFSNF